MFTAEQVAASIFCWKTTCLFWKGVFWGPQATLTASQACRRPFFFKRCVLGPQAVFTAEQAAAGIFVFWGGSKDNIFFKTSVLVNPSHIHG